jgi:hypothetical protein
MAKSKRRSLAGLSPLSVLRPRLDKLLRDPAIADLETSTLKANLNAHLENLDPIKTLPILFKAIVNAPEEAQARLDDVMPSWLMEHSYGDNILTLIERHRLSPEEQEIVGTWLEDTDAALPDLKEYQQRSLFYEAYTYSNFSQGLIIVLWHTDHRRRRVQGFNFLLDYNPPWEGAIKDSLLFPPLSERRIQREHIESWAEKGADLEPLNAAEAKEKILNHLMINRQEGIRLPRDLIRARHYFIQHVLSLPDSPNTPTFRAEDFDTLSRVGKTPESIMHLEQTMGRRVRMADGEESIIVDMRDLERRGMLFDDT